MKIEYFLTLAYYQAAQNLAWRQTLSRRAILFAANWCLPSIGYAAVLLLCRRIGMPWSVLLVGFVLGLVFNYASRPLFNAQMFKKKFDRRYPDGPPKSFIEVGEEGVSSAVEGTDSERFTWSAIVRFAQDEKMTLFYIAKNRFVLFPTSALSSEQRAELNDLVARHVVKR